MSGGVKGVPKMVRRCVDKSQVAKIREVENWSVSF